MLDESQLETAEWRPGGEVGRGAPLRGAGDVSAILPNGRVIWLRVEPSPAPARTVDHLAQGAASGAARRRASTRRHTLAIDLLSRATAAATRHLDEAKRARARALRRRISRSYARLDERISKAAEKARTQLRKQLEVERETVRRLHRRDLWDKAVLATSLPLFAAYGQKGRPFGAANLALTLSSLIWLLGDEVVEAIFGRENKSSPYPLRDTDAWSYIAPIGNLLAGWWLLGDFQHERFVAGRSSMTLDPVAVTAAGATELVYQYLAPVSLSRILAPSHRPNFETFKDVPAVATIATVERTAEGTNAGARISEVSARVMGTDLVLRVTAIAQDLSTASNPIPALFSSLDVAWMVDTQKPATVASS